MDAIKFLKGSDSEIEGLAIPYGGPMAGGKDLHGETFTPDTDLALDWFPQGRPLIYDHGLDAHQKTSVQGRQTEHEMIDEGVWVHAVLDTSAKYHTAVARLIAAGKMFFSSGAMAHLVDVDPATGAIKRWPWVELTMTPTPANPYAAMYPVKSVDLVEHLGATGLDVPADLIAAALKALDSEDDDGLPDGLKFADHADRLLADVAAFRERTGSLVGIRAKAGRVLSQTTRERLSRHPGSLRELADDLDALLSEADADKGKSIDIGALALDTERTLARLNGVLIPSPEGVTAP